MGNKYYVGIDLGTTNTLVSYVKGGKTRLIKFDGKDVLPSVIFVDTQNNDEIYVGTKAYREGNIVPANRVMSAKTYMGSDKKYIFYSPLKGKIEMTPTDVAVEVLKKVREKIVAKLKLNEDDEICAVITTPAAFSFTQNEETKLAGKLAGFNVLGTRPEPVAAAIACVKDIDEEDSTILVVDIGGGTYDTAIIEVKKDSVPNTISSEGDRLLGGNDIDKIVFEYLKKEVEFESGIDLSSFDESGLSEYEYNRVISTLHDRAKEAKEALTTDDECKIVCENLYTLDEPVTFYKTIKREKFDEICKPIYDKIEIRLDKSIQDFEKKTKRSIKEVSHLVLVGGTCYIPAIIELIEKKVGMTSVSCSDKTTAVAEGAAVIADSWTKLGSAIGGILAQSMGIRIKGNILSKIIEKGSKYPCQASKMYTTTYDNQTKIDICVYAAAPDKENVEDINQHEYYGFFALDNIEKQPKGVPQIEVTFSFDDSQQLTVSARDIKTGNEKKLVVSKGAYIEQQSYAKKLSIDLLIDVSGSMRGISLIDAQNACRKMVSEIVDLNVHEMGITTFNNVATNICSITNDIDKLYSSIDKMVASHTTKMGNGIIESSKKLQESGKYDKIIFLMTDGAPDSGDKSEQIAAELKQKGIKLAVIFIGDPGERGFRIAMNIAAANADSGEKPLFYTSDDMSNLGNIFKRVYADITLAD